VWDRPFQWGYQMAKRAAANILASIILVISAQTAQATVVTLDLSGAIFSDGGTASGSVTIDYAQPGVYVLEDYDITTTGGSLLSGQTYQVAGISLSCAGCELILGKNGGSLDIYNSIISGTIPSALSGAETSSGFPIFETRYFTAGSWVPEVTQAVTPLPDALPLFATGLGALGLVGWWRKRKVGAALAT
jgi:hypothetical protein